VEWDGEAEVGDGPLVDEVVVCGRHRLDEGGSGEDAGGGEGVVGAGVLDGDGGRAFDDRGSVDEDVARGWFEVLHQGGWERFEVVEGAGDEDGVGVGAFGEAVDEVEAGLVALLGGGF
jgi:hypothetical protein